MCRLSTGGGHAKRSLYTDDDEHLIEASKPILINGIEDVITRSDLADRSIFIQLYPITESSRRPEAEFWQEFDQAAPRILGALLDALVAGLQNRPTLKLNYLPRMADFALWSVACEPALPWRAGTFTDAYAAARAEIIDSVIDSDPVASAVVSLMTHRDEWTGTATRLLEVLGEEAGPASKMKSWPKSANALSRRLKRAASFLRFKGIEFDKDREGKDRERTITVRKESPP